MEDPSSGMPKMSFTTEQGPIGTEKKLEWVNGYIQKVFGGEEARLFSLD
jgi:hypothetical protein